MTMMTLEEPQNNNQREWLLSFMMSPMMVTACYSAIAKQLKSIGLHSGVKNELRYMVADHLDANIAFYVSQSVAYTEAPNVEDAYIATLDVKSPLVLGEISEKIERWCMG